MKRFYLIIGLILISITTFSQEFRHSLCMDVVVQDTITLNFLNKVESKLSVFADNDYNKSPSNLDLPLDNQTYESFKKMKKFETNIYRVYFYSSTDYQKLYVFAFAKEYHFRKSDSYDCRFGSFCRNDEFTTEPLFVIPLSKYTFLNLSEQNKLNECIGKLIQNQLYFPSYEENNNGIGQLIYKFNESQEFKSFDYIDENFLDSTFSFYKSPLLSEHRLNDSLKLSYKSMLADELLVYDNNAFHPEKLGIALNVTGFGFSIESQLKKEQKVFDIYKSMFTIEIKNNFLGLLLSCDSKNYNKIIWVNKKDMLTKLNNPTFEKGIDYIFANKILTRFK